MDPTAITLNELADAVAGRTISAQEALGAYLERIERIDPGLNAFQELYPQRARARARAVDDGQIRGPLAGVPVAIKDNLCTAFGHTTCSSRILKGFQAPYSATAIRNLEDAGAIILGKTRLDEFAMGSSTENSAFGTVRNPWDPQRVPGGSSGGSAAAVAADLCAGALGSDTGGSIRQPAAFTGIVGLKPTYGRVSRFGLVAFASSLDQIGPLGRTVRDVALLLGIISGPDRRDSTCAQVEVPDYLATVDEPISGLRVGLAREYLSDANDPAMARAIQDAIKTYEGLGASIVPVDLPHTKYGIPTYYIVASAEASSNLARYDGVRYGYRCEDPGDLMDLYARSRAEGFGDEVKRRIMLGTHVLCSGYYDAYYLRALKVRRLIKEDFDVAFQSCDVILCPTTTGPAFRIGQNTDDPLQMYLNDIYTVNCNLAGIPGISIPAGFAPSGPPAGRLPLGIQLLGPLFSEPILLRAARMFEKATRFHESRPPL